LSLHEFPVRGDGLHQSPRRKPGGNSSQQPAGLDMAPRRAILANIHRTSPIDRARGQGQAAYDMDGCAG